MRTTHHRSKKRLAGSVALVSALLVSGVATPATAALARPTGLKVASTESPVFEWTRVSGATSYKVEIKDRTSGRVLVTTTTTNRRYVPTRRVAASSSLEWRVQAAAGSSRSSWASTSVKSPANPAPKLLSPTDEAPLPQPATPPLLQWGSVPGAEEYIVEVSRDENFVEPRKYTSESTAFVVPDPQANAQYWWRVTADLGSGLRSATSHEWSYRIGRLGEVTSRLIEDWDDPDNMAGVPHRDQVSTDDTVEDVVFDWDPVPGAVTYELWVSSDPDFNKTGATVEKLTNVKGTRYSPSKTYDNDQYYWKVRAVNARKETVEWPDVNARTFKREWPLQPALMGPTVGQAAGDPLNYQWAPLQHSSHYELQLGTDPNFSPGTYEVCRTASTTFTPTGRACSPTPGRLHYWRVRGVDAPAGVVSLWSENGAFVYRPDRVTQRSPEPGATVAVPTLRWEATRNAQRYVVTVLDESGRTAASTTTYALSWTPSLDPGAYTWKVRYRDFEGTESPELPGTDFVVTGDAPTTGRAAMTPLTGTDEEAGSPRFPSLSWEPMEGAAHYRVSIGTHGSGFFFHPSYDSFLTTKFKHPAATDVGIKFLTTGRYDWFVTAYDANDREIGHGPVATFTIANFTSVSGQRLALTGTALDEDRSCTAHLDNPVGPDICTNVPSTPVLEWDPVPDAAFYKVYVSRDRELTNVIYTGSETSNTRWTPTSPLPDSQAGTPYHWVVRPCLASGICAPDPAGKAKSAGHAFDKRSPAPAALASTAADDITFTWQDYLATNEATSYEATGERSYQSAEQYRVEVSTTRSFAGDDVVDSRVVDQPTYTAFSKTYPEGPLHWRVQAIDDAGNALAWSRTASFTKSSGAPTLEGFGFRPVEGTAPLRWSWTNFAKSYTVEVYADDRCEALSPTRRILNETTAQAAFVRTRPIPAGATYMWRVRRNDADGRPGAWSPCSKFTTAAGVPSHIAPAKNAYVSAKDSLFRWKAVLGAARYRFQLRPLNGSTSTTTTAYSAWAPLKTLKDGTYQWSVVALDAGGGTLGSTPYTTVRVDATAPRVTSKSPATRATVASSFRATFSERVTGLTSSTFTVTRSGTTKALPAKVTLSSTGRTATLKTTTKLKRGQTHVIRLTSKVKDSAGNALAPVSWKVKVS